MCTPAAFATIGAAVLGAGISVKQGNKAEKRANTAREDAKGQALKAEKQQEQDFNRLNKRSPNAGRIQAENTNAAKSGIGSTALTGAGGIDLGSLNLGQNTLLGG